MVALQEVDRGLARSAGVDQSAWFADRLGWSHAFAPALLGDPDSRWEIPPVEDPGGPAYGVALLSRLPVEATTRTRLPGGGAGERRTRATRRNPGWDREPRVALSIDVAVAVEAVQLVGITTAHLSYLPWRGMAQLRAAAAAGTRGGNPAVLAGDLNLPVWAVRLVLPAPWTHGGGGTTYPSPRPRTQPDHIAVTGGGRLRDVRVAAPTGSDHRALLATVAL